MGIMGRRVPWAWVWAVLAVAGWGSCVAEASRHGDDVARGVRLAERCGATW